MALSNQPTRFTNEKKIKTRIQRMELTPTAFIIIKEELSKTIFRTGRLHTKELFMMFINPS